MGVGLAPSASINVAVCGLCTRSRLPLKSATVWIGSLENSCCTHQAPSARSTLFHFSSQSLARSSNQKASPTILYSAMSSIRPGRLKMPMRGSSAAR